MPNGSILATLETQMAEMLALIRFAGPKQDVQDLLALMRFPEDAPGVGDCEHGNWSVRQVLGHITDTERVLAYRVLSAARGISGDLPLVRDDELVARAGFDRFPLALLMDDFSTVRHASLTLYASLDVAALHRRVMVGGSEFTARALVWVTAGHAYHHQAILREHYFGNVRSLEVARDSRLSGKRRGRRTSASHRT